jgi:cytochrome c biogenesis protein CcmG/thiol:disulfide interchange protein DsbE
MGKRSFSSPRTVLTIMVVALSLLALAAPGGGASKCAADFKLPDVLQGKDYTLSQFRGKVVMLNFFTFFCAPCREEMPDLNKIYNEYKGKGLQTIGIALSSDPTQIRFLVKQLGLDYPVLLGDDKISKAYGDVVVVPTTFIIDKQGNIAQTINGTRNREDFVKMVKALL